VNILILFSQPWRVGGAETHVEGLIKGLAEDKIIMAVNKGSDDKKLRRLQQKYPNLQIKEIQARGINIIQWMFDIVILSRIIKDNKIEVVSAQQRTAGIWAYLLYKCTGTPFVVTMHDPWHRAFFKKMYAKIFPVMVVVSKNLTEILIQGFGFRQTQINFINNGVDFTAFVPKDNSAARKIVGVTANSKIILHVSRLSNIKGAVSLALIESMHYVLSQNRDIKLIIIGEGPLRAEIEEKAKSMNQKYNNLIEILNFTDHIVDWYNAADIVVGEGRVAIETMACKRPVVAIRNSKMFFGSVTAENIAEAVEVNFDGTSFPVTPEILANEINKALNIDACQTEKIAQYIYKRLSIEDMAEKYHNVFMNCKQREYE
jgi:glycosyltransferase involved in cell wall biosynthesis